MAVCRQRNGCHETAVRCALKQDIRAHNFIGGSSAPMYTKFTSCMLVQVTCEAFIARSVARCIARATSMTWQFESAVWARMFASPQPGVVTSAIVAMTFSFEVSVSRLSGPCVGSMFAMMCHLCAAFSRLRPFRL